ncbi:MAG TPA: lamin tail domain-containing protein [Saprospiraceae bacterium]|nr:lamin tail domain-containing protein [Saprospiraceae bacterium]
MRILFYTFLVLFLSLNANAQVIINEISYNPPESNNDSLEYIEIYNAGSDHVDLAGWHISSAVQDTFPSVHLLPGEYFVTAINAEAMLNIYNITVHQWSSGALNNSGETIILLDASDNIVDSVAYSDSDPWPSEADGSGPSLELIDPSLDNNDGTNWQISGGGTGIIINGNEVSGTPGAQNSGGGTSGPAVTVNLEHLVFDPPHVVVAIGDSVRWVNSLDVLHNVNGQQSVYAGNPESFYSGIPAVGPWQYDHEFTVPGLNNYHCDVHVGSGMRGTVAVYDPAGYTPFPFAHLRLTDGSDGQHIFNGVPTTVRGVVHGFNADTDGYSFYIIDEDNIGINVFAFDPGPYTVTEGDELEIQGVIDQFNGLLEIIPDNITVLSTGNPLTPPTTFNELDESTEGSHIALAPFIIDSVIPYLGGLNIYVTDELGNHVFIRADDQSGITTADLVDANAVRGIGSQFDPSFPFISGYQIFALEFAHITGVPVISKDAILMTPNPAAVSISLQADFPIHTIEIYSTDGKLVTAQKYESQNANVDITFLHEGLYIVRAVVDEGIWTSLLSVVR